MMQKKIRLAPDPLRASNLKAKSFLNVVIQSELVRMRTQPNRVHFL
jgi:hypothetical protein